VGKKPEANRATERKSTLEQAGPAWSAPHRARAKWLPGARSVLMSSVPAAKRVEVGSRSRTGSVTAPVSAGSRLALCHPVLRPQAHHGRQCRWWWCPLHGGAVERCRHGSKGRGRCNPSSRDGDACAVPFSGHAQATHAAAIDPRRI